MSVATTGWFGTLGVAVTTPGRLLEMAPYPESLGVAETGSTSETKSVEEEAPPALVMAEAFPAALVPTDDKPDARLAVELAIEGVGKVLCPQLLPADVSPV